jgi:AcrR family transcriptional regulator
MSLFDEHKAERRSRILAAARRLIAERGYDGLTMRDLARASHVSVPTLYNLFGGKSALLFAELEETFRTVAASLQTAGEGSVVERAFAVCEAGNRDLLAVPRYSRELVHLFLVSEDTQTIRRTIAQRYIAMMAGILRDGRAAGELVAWADPVAVATRMFAHYVHAMIEWAKSEIDDEQFGAATFYGMSLMLLGLTRGRVARELARRAQEFQSRAIAPPTRRVRKGG